MQATKPGTLLRKIKKASFVKIDMSENRTRYLWSTIQEFSLNQIYRRVDTKDMVCDDTD
jgi:hypothetical protein